MLFIYNFRAIYPVSKVFFLIHTIDKSKTSHTPENKIILDVESAVTFFEDKLGILKHVQDVAVDLANKWNENYYDQPKVSLTIIKKQKIFFYKCNPKSVSSI